MNPRRPQNNFGVMPLTMNHLLKIILALGMCLLWPTARAQQQFQGVCSTVKIVIQQELTLERIGFEARLEVTNNDGQDPITDFFADLTFENPKLSTNGVVNDASGLFFVRAPELENINSVTGNGVIQPTAKAVVKWFIIPKIAAGGTSPKGVEYRVGCRLSGRMRGVEIPREILFAIPDTITVRPEPQLQITYFQPRDVQGDDPFTPEVESPIPFTLGVLVKNAGYGTAYKLKIDSQQPKIVENQNGLLLIARLLGARVQDSPLRSASLLVDLGDIPPGQTRKGAWDMITSLSGEFIEFKASYKHASELGGEETSVITSLNAHFIANEVMNDQPGRDEIKDFLADVDRDPSMIPDTLFESEGNETPVYYATNATMSSSLAPGNVATIQLQADVRGWNYLRMTDPGQARLKIASVVRSDGKVINTNNYWTNIRYTRIGNIRQNYFNLLDLVDLGAYTYTVTYTASAADTNPPVTTLRFVGPVTEAGGWYYITPQTQIYFTAEDANPVAMYYSLTNGPFVPAYPFWLTAPGSYTLRYFAQDSSGNTEATNHAVLVVSGEATLDFALFSTPVPHMQASGDALSIRPNNAPIIFQAAPNPATVNATLDIYQGVIGWATISNAPSSPTADGGATLYVGGAHVDYYKYRHNGGAWSSEFPITTPIQMTNLSAGLHLIEVLGRSRHGIYLDASQAARVSWTVSPAAPATTIAGAPATPGRQPQAVLQVGGQGVTAYRWTINNGYYRPEEPISTLLLITNLSPGWQTVSVNARTNGVFQGTNNPTTVQWLYDPMYGYLQPGLALIRSLTFTNIGTTEQQWVWDGRGSNGVVVMPGTYTVRLTLVDALNRTNFMTRLIQVGDLSGPAALVAEAARGPRNPHARGSLAVWQDQSDGNWEIYAQDLGSNGAPIVKITETVANQENPRTDGRYIVWQGRQPNGTWDIYIKDVRDNSAPRNITSSPTRDEINPAVHWPWVVYQARSADSPNAPWQLRAWNAITDQSSTVSPSQQDQLDPDVRDGQVVWQDFRDVGYGEIYYRHLETGEFRRITANQFGQYHPVIDGRWIVWQDNRHGQVELYGYDFRREAEIRLTQTPEDESLPFIEGEWVMCQESSLGSLSGNLRLLHLPTRRLVPVTRSTAFKTKPAMTGRLAIWQEADGNAQSIRMAELPSLQGVFENPNTVVVTPALATAHPQVFSLLALWQQQAGVVEISRFTSLTPSPVKESAYWNNGAPAGVNFTLTPGNFLWVKFPEGRVVDLGINPQLPLQLQAGLNVVTYDKFPGNYSAFRLLRQLGFSNVRAVRMLDSEQGRWAVAEVRAGAPLGEDFHIPKVAVLMLDLVNPVSNFQP